MQALAGVSFVGLIVVSLVVGVRLLMLAHRTGQLPERALGSSLVVTMGLAYPGMILLEMAHGWSSIAERVTMFGLNVAIDIGFFLFFLFTARVFRPGWPGSNAVLLTAALAFGLHLVLVGLALASARDLAEGRSLTTYIGLIPLGTACLGYAWSGCESFVHWRRLLRRQRIGLVDPLLCNRMWLWAMMSFASVAGAGANLLFLASGIDVLARPDAMLITSMTGLAQGLFLWWTFLPPAFYRDMVARRAAARAS